MAADYGSFLAVHNDPGVNPAAFVSSEFGPLVAGISTTMDPALGAAPQLVAASAAPAGQPEAYRSLWFVSYTVGGAPPRKFIAWKDFTSTTVEVSPPDFAGYTPNGPPRLVMVKKWGMVPVYLWLQMYVQ